MTSGYLYVGDALAWSLPGFSCEEAAPVQKHLRPSPSLLLGPVPREFGSWYYGDRQAPPVALFRIDDVTLEGDRTLRRDGRTICIEQNGMHPQAIESAAPRSAPATVSRHDEVVLLCGPAYRMYGHWLVDFLPRLHVLTHLGLDLRRLRYLLPDDTAPFARQWLRLLGIADHQVTTYDVRTETCHVARALVPTAFRGDGRASTLLAAAARSLTAAVLRDARAQVAATRRLFVSRRNWGNDSRTLTNALAVEAQLAEDGFEIVYPEEMGIPEQVGMFSEARMLVGEYGSGLHNSIFCGPDATVIALRGTAGHPGFLQSGLCAALGQRMGYVFCGTSDEAGQQRLSVADEDLALLRSLLADQPG